MKNGKPENRMTRNPFYAVPCDPDEAAGEEYVVAGLMKIIRSAQRSKNPAVAAIGNEYAEFVKRVRDGRRRVEEISYAMR
jgi:hypothetical protein